MELEIQKFLRKRCQTGVDQAFKQLQESYGVYTKRHTLYPQLITFKYDMIEAKFSEKLTCEARGLILDESDNWNVVARAYDKFFNHGEGHAAPIDWSTARTFEKLDGSLCLVYWNKYSDKWEVATQGTPDACGPVGGWGFTFSELFWKTWNELGYKLPTKDMTVGPFNTYMFELCTSYNKIIVQHPKPRIVLHGMRCTLPYFQYAEVEYSVIEKFAKNYNWEVVKSYDLSSFEAIVNSCKDINPMECEGYVVCDDNFNRVKVKSPQYVALHSMIDGMGPRRLLQIARTNDSEEFLSYFEEYRAEFDIIKIKYHALASELEKQFDEIKYIADRKEFASHAVKSRLPAVLFTLKDKKVKTVKEYLSTMQIHHLQALLL